MMAAMQRFVRANLAVVIVCLVYALGLVYFATRPAPAPGDSIFQELSAPFLTYDGKTARMPAYGYRVLVVYSWASWCPYCEQGFQDLARIKEKYGAAIDVVAINRGEPLADARSMTDKLSLSGIEYLLDPEDSYYHSTGGFAMPEYSFVDSSSKVRYRQRGPMTYEQMDAELAELLR